VLREEHRLRVFENSTLRGILEPMTEEVTGGQKKYTLKSYVFTKYYDKMEEVDIGRAHRICGEMRNSYKVLFKIPKDYTTWKSKAQITR
jgi:hypothetical protein